MRIFPTIDMIECTNLIKCVCGFLPPPHLVSYLVRMKGIPYRDTCYRLQKSQIEGRGSSVIAPLSKNNKAMP